MKKNSKIHTLIKETEMNSIKSEELDIFNVFESKNIFSIKEFQRKYEWNKLQIEELIVEMEQHKAKKAYFMGMIILKKESTSNEVANLSIIDGQQRITTLFLILKSLEKNIEKYNLNDYTDKIKFDSDILQKIKDTYSDNSGKVPRLKISQLRGEDELENILIGNNVDDADASNEQQKGNKNSFYSPAFNTINDLLKNKDFKDLIEFYNKINKIKFSIVILGSEINEYKVFEDLNSKGVDLKIDDLIRNFFAQKAVLYDRDNPSKHIDNYEYLLNRVEGFLKQEKKYHRGYFSEKIGRWFKTYILYKVDAKKALSDINDKRMYNIYKSEVNNKITKLTDLLDEIQNIKSYLSFCMWMNNETNDLFLANDIELYPVYFEFYKNAQLANYKLEDLEKIFAMFYTAIICKGEQIKTFNKKYLENIKTKFYGMDNEANNFEKICWDIFEMAHFNKENIKQVIMNKISEDSVIWKEPKMKNFIIYFLSKMIKKNENVEIQLHKHEYNIEHIIPQSPKFDNISDSEDRRNQVNLWFVNVNRLKNLALIEGTLNEQLGNMFYNDKKIKFNNLKVNNSFLKSTKEIFKYEKFEAVEMNDRLSLMKTFADKFIDDLIFPKIRS